MSTLMDLRVRVSLATCRNPTVTADTVDDEGESTVSITDDDPQVTVSSGQAAYTVAEGGAQPGTVTRSADPERTVVIPIEATPKGWDRLSSPLTNEMSFVRTLVDGAASRMSRQQTHEMRSSE